MKKYLTIIIIVVCSQACTEWIHTLESQTKILDDKMVLKLYPDEKKPTLHSAVTVTDYLNKFDLKIIKINENCYRPEIKNWKVISTIYMRPKLIEGANGKPVPNPRWSKIKNFLCRENDPDFNVWDATYQHETIHFKTRKNFLNNFWKELATALKTHCSSSKQEAENYIAGIIKMFLEEVRKVDNEEKPREHEENWKKEEYKKISKVVCDEAGFIKANFPKAKVKVNDNSFQVEMDDDLFTGLKRNELAALISKKTGAKYFFKYGSLLAKEAVEGDEITRTEYDVNGQIKYKLWLKNNAITAKAWADDNYNLGKKVAFTQKNTDASNTIVTVIDTGYENFDDDGHGTFVQKIIEKEAGITNTKVQNIKTTTNLDESLLAALKSSNSKIINLSIGQRKFGLSPANPDYIKTVCSKLKEISKTHIIILGAGNDGALLDTTPFYPASCHWSNEDNALVIGSFDLINKNNANSGRDSSNWSSNLVHIMVSGNLFESYYPGGAKRTLGGTSFAAAYISGLAAKILKENKDITPKEIKANILEICSFVKEAEEYVKDGCVIKRGK